MFLTPPELPYKRHDQYLSLPEKDEIYITKVDAWADQVEFTRVSPGSNDFKFETATIAEFDWFIELGVFTKKTADDATCWHDWVHYIGFYDIYDYCAKCDLKREHKDYYCSKR